MNVAYKSRTLSGVMSRRINTKSCQFQDNWTEDYFIQNKGLPVCLLWNESVSDQQRIQLEESLRDKQFTKELMDDYGEIKYRS